MDKGKHRIVVTGATGKQGGAVARQLLARGHSVRAVTRKPDGDAAREIARLGAEVAKGDLDDRPSLERVLEDAWGVFAVQNTWEAGVEREEQQGKGLASVAKERGIRHFVYSSVGSAHRRTGIPHFDNKWRVEEHIRALGFESHTILRPVFFMENFLASPMKEALLDGKLVLALDPATRLQMIAVEDIGRMGLLAFERHAEMNGVAVDIAGDARTMPETAAILGRAIGRDIEFVRQPIDEVRAFSTDYAAMLEWFDRVGYDAEIAALEKRYDFRAVKLPDWASRQRWR